MLQSAEQNQEGGIHDCFRYAAETGGGNDFISIAPGDLWVIRALYISLAAAGFVTVVYALSIVPPQSISIGGMQSGLPGDWYMVSQVHAFAAAFYLALGAIAVAVVAGLWFPKAREIGAQLSERLSMVFLAWRRSFPFSPPSSAAEARAKLR